MSTLLVVWEFASQWSLAASAAFVLAAAALSWVHLARERSREYVFN